MKTKTDASTTLLIVMMLAALIILLLLVWRPTGAAAYDSGYPIGLGYPAPADPWCEESTLFEMSLPWWCPVIGEAVSTVASEPQPTETPAAIIKVGGRQKGREK